jgi:hypothetical protein
MIDGKTWQEDLMNANSRLFQLQPDDNPAELDSYPACRMGWQDPLERACARISSALMDDEVFSFDKIDKFHGALRITYNGLLSEATRMLVNEAIALAAARSVCVCETCGAKGLLYRRGNWLSTACHEHATGRLVPEKDGYDNVHFSLHVFGDLVRICSYRQYSYESDTFVDTSLEENGLPMTWLGLGVPPA